MTISSVPRGIPVWVVYWKVASQIRWRQQLQELPYFWMQKSESANYRTICLTSDTYRSACWSSCASSSVTSVVTRRCSRSALDSRSPSGRGPVAAAASASGTSNFHSNRILFGFIFYFYDGLVVYQIVTWGKIVLINCIILNQKAVKIIRIDLRLRDNFLLQS